MKKIPLYDVRPINDLKEMLESSAGLYGDKTAFLVKNKEGGEYSPISYQQFKGDVDALGTALVSLGLKGKRIAVIGENRYAWAVSYLAVVNGTGIIVPLDKELPVNEIENLLTRARVSAVIFSGRVNEQMAAISRKLDFIDYFIAMDVPKEEVSKCIRYDDLVKKGKELVSGGDSSFTGEKIDSEAMNILLFTSGTTDMAKAVMLSHRNICANLMSMCSMLYIDKEDTFLSVLPIHHTYECTCGFLCPIYRGAAIAYAEGLKHIAKNLGEAKTTVMLGVPLLFESMYNRIWDQAAKKPELLKKLKLGIKISNALKIVKIDVTRKLFAPIHQSLGGNVRIFISGAAGIDPIVAKGFRDFGIKLVQGYGLTECAPIVGLNRDVDFKDSAAGLPLPGLEVRIDNPDADGIGEIVVKGPSVMQGYYENEEATNKVFKNGWFHTGDAGFIDKDNFIHITGRKKNVIVTKNGKNIYPEEIEALLNRSPYIKESLVYGNNDNASGDVTVAATIVPDMEKIQELHGGREITREDINELIKGEIKTVNASLVLYKYIRDFKLREEEFAKTTTRKIKRYLEDTSA